MFKVRRQFEFTPKTSAQKLWLDWFCSRDVLLYSRGLLLLHSTSPLSSSIMVYEEHWCYSCSIVTETSLKFIKFSWLLLRDDAYYMLSALLFQSPGCWNCAVSFCLLRFSPVCLLYSLLLKFFFSWSAFWFYFVLVFPWLLIVTVSVYVSALHLIMFSAAFLSCLFILDQALPSILSKSYGCQFLFFFRYTSPITVSFIVICSVKEMTTMLSISKAFFWNAIAWPDYVLWNHDCLGQGQVPCGKFFFLPFYCIIINFWSSDIVVPYYIGWTFSFDPTIFGGALHTHQSGSICLAYPLCFLVYLCFFRIIPWHIVRYFQNIAAQHLIHVYLFFYHSLVKMDP